MAIARLHLITPTTIDDAARAATDAALAAGVRWLQVRQKAGSDRRRLAVVAELVHRSHGTGGTCVVNDRADLAFAAGADGVHLGLDDLPVADARRLLGPDAVIGATCRDADDARRAQDAGASYLGVGPAYRSRTKTTGLPDPVGPAGIAAVAAAVRLPVIAISGITLDRVPELLDAGAHGVAVVAAVYGAERPGDAAAALLEAVGEATPAAETSR
ncbi:MAG: thiamine phosphate synthase [Acidimicrobiales bacterium]